VDNFGVKYVGKEHIDHLIKCIKTKYILTKDWAGDLDYGIKLNWDYTACTLNVSMPGYIKKLLQKYKHCIPSKPQCCPYSPATKQYGKQVQASIPIDVSPKLSPDSVQQYPLLCLGRGHHCPYDIKLNCNQTNKEED
jgi:hypothetical protein